MDSKQNKSGPAGRTRAVRRISYAGLAAALILFALLICRFLPTGRFTVYVVTSLILMLVVELADLPAAIGCFVAAGLLSVPLVGLPQSWPFLILFGPWPLLKALIEGRLLRNPLLSQGGPLRFWCVGSMVKLPALLILIGAAFAIFRSFVMPTIKLWEQQFGLGAPLLALILLAGALLYDFILSILMVEYRRRLKPLFDKRLNRRG